MKNQPSHHARFAPETTDGVIAGNMTCLTYFHPVRPKLREDSATFVGIPRIAPSTPKKMAQAIEVKSSTITDNSMPKGPRANRKPMTIGKYPSIGIDCRRSMKGVRISDAHLFVAASMPNETPQTTDTSSVIAIRETVLRVYNGRFLVSGYGMNVTISHVMTMRMSNPAMKLIRYLRKPHSPA